MVLHLNRDRFIDTMQTQAEIGGTADGGLHRLALSPADKQIRDWFVTQLEDAGLDVRIDAFGNIFGRRPGSDTTAPPVLIGSHLDSQPHGGIYDGALGVVAALEVIRTLNDQHITTKNPIEVVNWTNEEGSRFQPAMQGSGVWAGAHDLEIEYAKTDSEGTTLESALEEIGYKGRTPAEPTTEYDSYLELHIEQGPSLESGGYQIGIVTGIVGFVWGELTFSGEANHSGTTPMQARHDALVGAAEVIQQVRRIPTTLRDRTVGTVGHIAASPNSINIIPGEVTFTVGFRDPDDEIVEHAYYELLKYANKAAIREGLQWKATERMRIQSVDFAPRCINAVELAVRECDYPATKLVSGAGHDASHTARVCDTGMIFAPSEGGISHSPDEYTSWDDCFAAANTLAYATHHLST